MVVVSGREPAMNTSTESAYSELLQEIGQGKLSHAKVVLHAVRMGVSVSGLMDLLAIRHADSHGASRAVICCDDDCTTLCYRYVDIVNPRMN